MKDKTRQIALSSISKEIVRARKELEAAIESKRFDHANRILDLLKGLTEAHDDLDGKGSDQPDWIEPVRITRLSFGGYDKLLGPERRIEFDGRLGSKGSMTFRCPNSLVIPKFPLDVARDTDYILSFTKVQP